MLWKLNGILRVPEPTGGKCICITVIDIVIDVTMYRQDVLFHITY